MQKTFLCLRVRMVSLIFQKNLLPQSQLLIRFDLYFINELNNFEITK
jgi:hypothetical protein